MASNNRSASLYLIFTLSLIAMSLVSCKRILMVPFLNTSHTIILHSVASRLASRGHSVTVLWASEFIQSSIIRHPNYTLIEFSMRMKPEEFEESVRAINDNFAKPLNVSLPSDSKMELLTRLKNYFEIGRSMNRLGQSVSKVANTVCKVVLSDEILISTLRNKQFDIALVDDFFLARCLLLIPNSLGVLESCV